MCATKKEYRSRAFYTNYYAYQDRAYMANPDVKEFSYIHDRIAGIHFGHAQPYSEFEPRIVALLLTPTGHEFLGFNSKKTHPLQKRYALNEHKIYLHAEIDCLVKAARTRGVDLKGAVISVYRWTKDNKPALSFPCDGCFQAIKASGIAKIKFFDADGVHRALDLKECK